jgi:WD40 repeat protein
MWKCSFDDEAVSAIDVCGTNASKVAVGTFRPFSGCGVYLGSRPGFEAPKRLHHNFPIADLKFSSSVNGTQYLVTASDFIRLWNADNGHLLSVMSPHAEQLPELCPFTAVSFAPSSDVFAVVDIKGFCSVWNVSKGTPLEVYEIASEKLVGVSFVSSNVIGCVGESGALYVLDRSTHEAICSQGATSVIPRCQPVKLAWLPHLSLVGVAYQVSGCVSLFDLRTPKEAPRLIGTTSNGGSIADICWLETNPEYLVVARDNGQVQVWSKNNLNAPHFEYREANASCLRAVPDGVLVGTSDGKLVHVALPSNMSSNIVPEFSDSCMPTIDQEATASYPALA